MKISTPPAYRLLTVLAVVLVLLTGIPVETQATKPLKFIAVNVNDNDYMRADQELVKRLRDRTGLDFAEEPQDKYGRMIRKLLELKEERYVARVTPYVYVVAEMMGAEFDVLATYQNMTDRTTYNSWFVVNRSSFPNLSVAPTVDQLFEKLREQSSPPKFIYHDKFSTSSYFLPSLEFRSRNIFSMQASTGDLIAIHSEKLTSSSTESVRKVANNEAFLAAVWDGTKNKFDNAPEAAKVFFVKIPTVLPNDLLVCSARVDQESRDKLREAIKNLGNINIWDFKTWSDIRSESTAKEALAALRHSAELRPAPVTVKVDTSQRNPPPSLLATLETIKHAVRLSGTEMVPFDPHFHKRQDVDWNIQLIHDGAINLISTISNTKLEQQYQISFTDGEDLTKRIGSFIHSRMHRIRYIWPYDDERPIVVRDTAFPISAETQVKVMSITWTDPQKNAFSDGDSFNAKVVEPTPFGFQLASSDFPKNGNFYDFDPMSNVSYRVVLVRSSSPGRMFTVLTYAFVGLLVLAAAGAFFDMRRKAKKPGDLPLVDIDDFKRTCRELAAKYRSFWRKHELTEADVLWCDRDRLEKIIADLKATADFNAVKTRSRSVAILANIPVVSKLLGLTVGAGLTRIITTDPSKFSDAQRLEDTLKYLIDEGALSTFADERLEWNALNQIASNIFEPFSLATSQAGENNGDGLIRTENPILVSLIAKHFNGVIQESKEKVCFFGRKWTVTANETEQTLVCTADLLTPIKLNGGNSAVPKTVQRLTLRAQVSRDADLCDLSQGGEVNAWLFGKIHRVEPPRNGDGNLFLNFRPAALVRTDDSE